MFPPRQSMRLVRDTIDFSPPPRCRGSAQHRSPAIISARPLDSCRGTGVHAGERLRLRRAGRSRPDYRSTTFARLSFLRPHRLLRGDRQVPRRPSDLGTLDRRARDGAESETLMQLYRFHCQTAGVSLTASSQRSTSCAPDRGAGGAYSAEPSRCPPTRWTKAAGAADREGPLDRTAHPAGDRHRANAPTSPIRSVVGFVEEP